MNNNPIISIIIPVYNTGENLRTCIDSILNQTYKEFEILIINDGSTDNTKDICEEYNKQYSAITVLNQNNLGVSAARNKGIYNSKGTYLMFVDSDDWIEERSLEVIIKSLEEYNSDILMFGRINDYFKDGNLIKSSIIGINNTVHSKIDEINKIWIYLFNSCDFPSSCNKVFRAEIIKTNLIEYNVNSIVYEDFDFNLRVLNKCSNITIISENLYHYNLQSDVNPLSKRDKLNLVYDISEVVNSLNNFLNKINLSEKHMMEMYSYIFNLYLYCLKKIAIDKKVFNLNDKMDVLKSIKLDNNFKNIMNSYGNEIRFYKIIYHLIKYNLYIIAYLLIKLKLD